MSDDPAAVAAGSIVAEHWAVEPRGVSVLTGGMNSRTWAVTTSTARWVLKVVPAAIEAEFRTGLTIAVALDAAGIPAGRPLPTRAGGHAVTLADGSVAALLSWVDGAPLDRSPETAARIGAELARAHAALRDVDVPGAPSFDWVDPDAGHLDVEPWVRPAVREVLEQWESARGAVPTWGLLHGDPAPEAFLHDPSTDVVGIIDWSSSVRGPLLYDLASAAMYLGPELTAPLVEGYATTGVVGSAELDDGLGVMQRYRYAVQADYFARRVWHHDLTGVDDPAENQGGLDDAKAMLGA